MVKPESRRLFLAMAGAAMASGCVLAPVGPRYPQSYPSNYPQGAPAPGPAPGPYPSDEVVSVAPPAPQYEVVGVAPAAGMLFLAGTWLWLGGRYSWRPGYWAYPRPGHRWVPHAWVPHGRGWVHRPGYWYRG